MKLKKVFKWIGILLGSLVLILLVTGLLMNEPLPEHTPGPAADQLAENMLQSINKEAWDSTGYIAWTFKGVHHFRWDRKRNWVEVTWKDIQVQLDLDLVQGVAKQAGTKVAGEKADKLVQTAWAYFCNDSFWLNAPAKVFDPGTERAIVHLEDGSEALLVTYTSGGVTPGDSYLWIVDENFRPVVWKMWVRILPIGGGQFSWEDWQILPTGAWLAHLHKSPVIDLDISEVEAAFDLSDIFGAEDPFATLALSKE